MRVLLIQNPDGTWRYTALHGDGSNDGPPGDLTGNGTSTGGEADEFWDNWASAIDQVERKFGMKCMGRVVLDENEDGPSRIMCFLQQVERKRAGDKQPRISIDAHSKLVQQIASRMAAALDLPADIRHAFNIAATSHDLGKADPRWQAAIGNDDLATPLAKSIGRRFNAKALNGYRHEFGSLRHIAGKLPSDAEHDLALHLLAVHHGRGRPHFDLRAMSDSDGLPPELPAFLQPAEMARRFARLQRRFGHWGLAWLESILMAGDAEASASPGSATEDEEEEA